MQKTISGSTNARQKKIKIAVHQLPEIYNKLLGEYVLLLQEQSANPYEFSIKKRFLGFFNIKEQADYAASPYISNFLKTPDALAQELPAAGEMLKKLDKFDDQTVRALAKLNSLNLSCLRKRSIRNQIIPGLALTGSALGLLLDLQDVLAISIKDAIAGLSGFNISLALKLIIILVIAFAILIAGANWMFTTPRIGAVAAFGDILGIAMSHRDLRE
jgi:hypothetical protein